MQSSTVIAAALLAAGTARAQRASLPADTGRVAVRIFAEASAREVRFASQPELHVRLLGRLDSIHVLERRNLPTPVAVGRTYRDVYVAVEIFGRVNADCITRELLGRAAPRDSLAAQTQAATTDCASLEVRAAPRPPADSAKPPRR